MSDKGYGWKCKPHVTLALHCKECKKINIAAAKTHVVTLQVKSCMPGWILTANKTSKATVLLPYIIIYIYIADQLQVVQHTAITVVSAFVGLVNILLLLVAKK